MSSSREVVVSWRLPLASAACRQGLGLRHCLLDARLLGPVDLSLQILLQHAEGMDSVDLGLLKFLALLVELLVEVVQHIDDAGGLSLVSISFGSCLLHKCCLVVGAPHLEEGVERR